MSDEYQLRKDVDRLYDEIYDAQKNQLTVITYEEYDNNIKNYYTQSEVDLKLQELINIIYPVGSIYLSVNDVNPGLMFGGEWEQIEDTFLLSAGTNYQLGDTGGSKDAVLVEHNHSVYAPIYNQGTQVSTSNHHVTWGSHGTSDLTVISTEGEDGTDKNMPPYVVVNVWKRIN